MRRPWQIWLSFVCCLALVCGALGWLSVKLLDMEQEREQRRVEAELEEEVRQALWHIDSLVMPILAQENAWPHFAYRPYYGPAKKSEPPIASPLLTPNNDFVRINFEIGPDNQVSSPQYPPAKFSTWAISHGSSEELLDVSKKRVDELQAICSRDELLPQLPEETVGLSMVSNELLNWNPAEINLGNSGITSNGTLNLTGANTYTGSTTVNGGTLGNTTLNANLDANPLSVAGLILNNSTLTISDFGTLAPPTLFTNGIALAQTDQNFVSNANARGAQQARAEGNAQANQGSMDNRYAVPRAQVENGQGYAYSSRNSSSSINRGGNYIAPNGTLQQAANPRQSQDPASVAAPAQPQQADAYSANYDNNQNAVSQPANAGDSNRDQQQAKNSLDLQQRSRAFQQFGFNTSLSAQKLVQNKKDIEAPLTLSTSNVREGMGKPVWIGEELLFARRVSVDGQVLIQGCWLDWPKLKDWLTGEVSATLPTPVTLQPVSSNGDDARGRMLATLPAKLVVPPVEYIPESWFTPMRGTLAAAWGGAGLAALAVGMLLAGVMTLSERRAAFVSAVTHELRTPLTTFRMYAEMLSEGMVKDEQQSKQYLNTLRAEADRLTHLVGNVLTYARLERTKLSSRLRLVTVAELIDRCRERLVERAKQANLELVEAGDETLLNEQVRADAAVVEQILFNLIDNACKYATPATDRRLHLEVERRGGKIRICVRDHGPGVSPKEAKRLFQPFRKSAKDAANSAPGVGLGLALCQRLAHELGGTLTSEQCPESGACFVLTLPAVA